MNMLGKGLARDTALLTLSSLWMRCVAMSWQVWLAGRIGAAGIGLLHLVMSVGSFFMTLAISGVRFAATRLLAEELGAGREGALGAAVRCCSGYAALFGTASALVLRLCAAPLGDLWIRDTQTVPALSLLALSLPAVSLSGVLTGYFTAVGRVWKGAAEQMGEQLLRMGLTALFLLRADSDDRGGVCAAVVLAGVVADTAGLAALFLLYRNDRRRHAAPPVPVGDLAPRLLRLALPLALSACARSLLGTCRQLLVPRSLERAGMAAEAALAGYGVVSGMALPVLLFPTAVLTALSEVLVPALTGAQVAGRQEDLRQAVHRLLRLGALFSLTCALIFYLAADVLGGVIYGDGRAALYIRRLAPLVPFLYTDIVTDGCLKGLGQMTRSMVYNLLEAALGLVLTALLLPRRALAGYILLLYLCEIFNFSLSLRRLYVITRPRRAPHSPASAVLTSSQSSRSRKRISYVSPPSSALSSPARPKVASARSSSVPSPGHSRG